MARIRKGRSMSGAVSGGTRPRLTKKGHQSFFISLLEEVSETKARKTHEAMLLLASDWISCELFRLRASHTLQIPLHISQIDESQLRSVRRVSPRGRRSDGSAYRTSPRSGDPESTPSGRNFWQRRDLAVRVETRQEERRRRGGGGNLAKISDAKIIEILSRGMLFGNRLQTLQGGLIISRETHLDGSPVACL